MISFFGSAVPIPAAPSHSIARIEPIPFYDDDVFVTGMNDNGEVTGYCIAYGGSTRAFQYTAGVTTDLGAGFPWAINDSGVVVGQIGSYAARWVAGVPETLAQTNSWSSVARGINSSGLIVGYIYSGTPNSSRPTLWRDGSLIVLDKPPGTLAGTAYAVNDAGQVLVHGTVATSSDRTFVWTEGIGFVSIGTPSGWTIVRGHAINNKGQICGIAYAPQMKGFFWDPVDGFSDSNVGFSDINDAGCTVEYDNLFLMSTRHAIGDMIPPDSDWSAFTATSVNNHGSIAGKGWFGASRFGFVMMPTAPPPSLISRDALELKMEARNPSKVFVLQGSSNLVDWVTEEEIVGNGESFQRFRTNTNANSAFWRLTEDSW